MKYVLKKLESGESGIGLAKVCNIEKFTIIGMKKQKWKIIRIFLYALKKYLDRSVKRILAFMIKNS